MKGDIRCIDGRLFRHDPQWDDPDLETDVGQCPECEGNGCGRQDNDEATVVFPVRHLNAKGQCCGRKPLVYKRPTHYLFCFRCDAAYDPSGTQVQNWAWKWLGDHFEPTYPDSEGVALARKAIATPAPQAPSGGEG